MRSRTTTLTLAGVMALVGAKGAAAAGSAGSTWCCSTFDGQNATQCTAMSSPAAKCGNEVITFNCEPDPNRSPNAALVCSPSAGTTDPKVKDCRCVTVLSANPNP
jgi:hypothetical protein